MSEARRLFEGTTSEDAIETLACMIDVGITTDADKSRARKALTEIVDRLDRATHDALAERERSNGASERARAEGYQTAILRVRALASGSEDRDRVMAIADMLAQRAPVRTSSVVMDDDREPRPELVPGSMASILDTLDAEERMRAAGRLPETGAADGEPARHAERRKISCG